MGSEPHSIISQLQEAITPISPTESIAEAGRKILLKDFIHMLEREAGSRSGEDIEDVHKMRVAIRRMRSVSSLLYDNYTSKSIRPLRKQLKKLAKVLGNVRDLDVVIAEIETVQASVADEEKQAFDSIIKRLNKQRKKARKKLNAYLDSKDYLKFVARTTVFLTKEGKGVAPVDEYHPYQVRHVVPILISEALAQVRAYDPYIPTTDELRAQEESDEETSANLPEISILHALRIEVKCLRYIVTSFEDVLGKTIADFIAETKVLQEHLGRISDLNMLEELMLEHMNFKAEESAFDAYLVNLRAERAELVQSFPDVWERFNTRTVQSKLSNAQLVLR